MRDKIRFLFLILTLSSTQLSLADETTNCPDFSGKYRLENADACVTDLRRDSPTYINFFPSNLMVSSASIFRVKQTGCELLTIEWSHPAAPGSPILYRETVEQSLVEGIYQFEEKRYSSSTTLYPAKSTKTLHVRWSLAREADGCLLYRLKLREQGWALVLPYIQIGTAECRFIPVK